jgi:predicted molibdopterin-dependent oxidoreductase YjgC
VGCTISYGTVDDRPVIVRPDRLNPFSRDQICVRGRFHYDAITDRERLSRHLARRGANLLPVSFEEALTEAIEGLSAVKREHGASAIAVLGSPLASNEEAYALARLAKDVIGTPHLDFSQGPLHRAVEGALLNALGVTRRSAELTGIEQAQTIVAVAGDLEESHNVVSLRIKDAVRRRGAKLVVVSSRWNELVPFAETWVQPAPGNEALAVHALAQAVAAASTDRLRASSVRAETLGDTIAEVPGARAADLAAARALAVTGAASEAGFAVVYAPPTVGIEDAAAQAAACANLAIAARGGDAASVLHYLPTDANVLGIADMGIAPGAGGKSFLEIIAAAQAGEVRALIVHRDNPLLNAPGTAAIEAALGAVPHLVVIDSMRSTTAERATVVLAEKPFFLSQGTTTNAGRAIGVNRSSLPGIREEREGVAVIAALANGLGGSLPATAPEVSDEIASSVAGYEPWAALFSGRSRALADTERTSGVLNFQPAPAPAPLPTEGLLVTTGRSLFTSWAGASIASPEADKLHREEHVLINPRDAETLGVRTGDEVVLAAGDAEVRTTVRLDDGVGPGWVYLPHYYAAGATMSLYPTSGGQASVAVRVRALSPV